MLATSIAPLVCVPRRTLPLPDEVAGGYSYEPKFDGMRAVLSHEDDEVVLVSRHGTRLDWYFPEIVTGGRALAPGTVLDGELVLWHTQDNGLRVLDFLTLCRRLGTAPARARKLSVDQPAMFIAFDVLWLGGHDQRRLTYDQRRALLEQVNLGAPLALCPATTEPSIAAQWFEDLAVTGVEGLVIKRRTSRYSTRGTSWYKLRFVNSIDLVGLGVVGSLTRPRQLLLGLPSGERMKLVAISATLSTAVQKTLTGQLDPLPDDASPWPVPLPATWYPGPPGSRKDDLPYRPVVPIVVEVAADVAVDHGRYRHPLGVLRPRPDLAPADVTGHP